MAVGTSEHPHADASGASEGLTAGRPLADHPGLLLVVGGVLALGVVLRFVCQSDLWADEVLSVNIAALPVGEIFGALRQDGAPPLYYLLLHSWMEVFGTGNASVRALSGVIGTATLIPIWFLGRRLDERRIRIGDAPPGSAPIVAWSGLLLFALSPFAIWYSTETRMYALVMLLSAVGALAVARALERPSLGRLAVVAGVTGTLLYTHYWAFPLLAVVAMWLAVRSLRGTPTVRGPAWRVLTAIGVGLVSFLPWLPTFWFQVRHTGTPWGAPVSPFGSWATAFKAFGGNTHAAGWLLVVLVGLGVFARAIDRRHFSVDMLTRPGVRLEAAVAFATLALGLIVARWSGTTFEGRYASVVFPLIVLVGAYGLTVFADPRVRATVLALALVLGAWGGASNAARNRTQAYQLTPILRDHAVPGDVVVYCPDSIGTDVARQLDVDLDTVTVPGPGSPERIDWVDYEARVRRIDPATFSERILRRAGEHAIWFVYTNNGTFVDQRCAEIADFLTLARPNRFRELEPDPYFFEHHGLYRYPAPTA